MSQSRSRSPRDTSSSKAATTNKYHHNNNAPANEITPILSRGGNNASATASNKSQQQYDTLTLPSPRLPTGRNHHDDDDDESANTPQKRQSSSNSKQGNTLPRQRKNGSDGASTGGRRRRGGGQEVNAGGGGAEGEDEEGEGAEEEGGWWKGIVEKFGSVELDNKGSVARDHLALERTFLAWLRTSLAFASIGIAITQLFRLNTTITDREGLNPSPTPPGTIRLRQVGKPLGATFLGIAIAVLIVGGRRYFESQYWIIRGKFPASRGSVFLVTFVAAALIITSLVVVCTVDPTAFEKR